MFEITALALQSPAQNLSAIAANRGATPALDAEFPGLPTVTTGNGDLASFEALLAVQSAPLLPGVAPTPTTLQAGGRILPEAAEALAASGKPTEAGKEVPSANTKDAAAEIETEIETETAAALPDPALLAAIFAAPDRLPAAPAPGEQVRTAAAAFRAAPGASAPAIPSPIQTPAASVAVASIIASTAQIELQPAMAQEPAPAPPLAASPSALATATEAPAAQESTQRTSAPPARRLAQPDRLPTAPADAAKAEPIVLEQQEKDPVPRDGQAPEFEPRTLGLAEHPMDLPKALPARAATDAPGPERIDFATLVDTLARAREEASPHRITVSVGHADFGRVALRFDQDDGRGMQVAMSSTDPGFAHAVTATIEAAQASGGAAGQHSGSAPSQQQGEASRQHQQPERAQPRAQWSDAPASPAEEQQRTPPRDGRGIYA